MAPKLRCNDDELEVFTLHDIGFDGSPLHDCRRLYGGELWSEWQDHTPISDEHRSGREHALQRAIAARKKKSEEDYKRWKDEWEDPIRMSEPRIAHMQTITDLYRDQMRELDMSAPDLAKFVREDALTIGGAMMQLEQRKKASR